jgi:nicotinate-nucleotide pyrophosphorylase (carboxylating)
LELSQEQIRELVSRALEEDLSRGDITTDTLIPHDLWGSASVLVKEKGVLAGIELAKAVFIHVEPSPDVKILARDGTSVGPGQVIATITGSSAGILRAERTALNFLQRLSGIASETARYVEAVAGLPVYIADTRKTTPGLRVLEKYAVRMGGGKNHRCDLGENILIKDNHLSALRSKGLTLWEIVTQARQEAPPGMKIEVEVETPEQALEATRAGADIIMLDNMTLDEMHQAVELVKGRAVLEASGGITLGTVRSIAETGVDFVSVGTITHSAKALDISLELQPLYPSPLSTHEVV